MYLHWVDGDRCWKYSSLFSEVEMRTENQFQNVQTERECREAVHSALQSFTNSLEQNQNDIFSLPQDNKST